MSKHRSSRRILRVGAVEPYGKPMGRSRSTVDRASLAPICQACAGEGGFPCPDCGDHQGRMYCGEGGCNAKNPGIRLCYACNGTGHDSQVGMARVKKASGPPPVDGPSLDVIKYLKRPDASQEYIRAALEPRRGWQYEEMLAVALANPNMPLDILPDFANFEDIYLKAFIDNPAIDIWTFENPALFWDIFKDEHCYGQGSGHGESDLRIFGQGGYVYQQRGKYYSPISEMQQKYRDLYLGQVIARIGEFDQEFHGDNEKYPYQIELTASGVYIVRDRYYDSYVIDSKNMLWAWKNQYHGSVSASRMSSMKTAKKAPAKLRLADFLNSAKLREGDWQQIFNSLGVPVDASVGRARPRQLTVIGAPALKVNKEQVEDALARAGNSPAEAAKILGIGLMTIYRAMERYDITPQGGKERTRAGQQKFRENMSVEEREEYNRRQGEKISQYWSESSPEQRAVHGDKIRRHYDALSDEDKRQHAARARQHWEQMSEEEQRRSGERSRQRYQAMSEEQRREWNQHLRQNNQQWWEHLNTDANAYEEWVESVRQGWSRMSEEDREAFREDKRQWFASLPEPEQKRIVSAMNAQQGAKKGRIGAIARPPRIAASRGRVGMALNPLEDPNATAEEKSEAMKQLLASPPEVLVMSPHCPTDIWWKLARKHPELAISSPLGILMTLEDPTRWESIEAANAPALIDREIINLPAREQVRFAAECAARALPIYEAYYKGDMRGREALDAVFAYADGRISESQLSKTPDAYGLTIDASRDEEHELAALAIRYALYVGSAKDVPRTATRAIGLDYAHNGQHSMHTGQALREAQNKEALWQWRRLREYLRAAGLEAVK